MAKQSKETKHYWTLHIIFLACSIIAMFAPLAYYFVEACMVAEEVQKVTLGLTFTVAAIITGLNVMFKKHYRSAIWIVILGIYMCIQEIMPLLISVAVATIMDEFIFTPLARRYKTFAQTNGQIDKRLGVN